MSDAHTLLVGTRAWKGVPAPKMRHFGGGGGFLMLTGHQGEANEAWRMWCMCTEKTTTR
jgi:hypothetical protein